MINQPNRNRLLVGHPSVDGDEDRLHAESAGYCLVATTLRSIAAC